MLGDRIRDTQAIWQAIPAHDIFATQDGVERGMSRIGLWDNIGAMHNAIGNYVANNPCYVRRIQVMATLDDARLVA